MFRNSSDGIEEYTTSVTGFINDCTYSNPETSMRASAVPDDCVITLSAADVSKNFKQVNIQMAAGPD
jgi:hypothetical protein